MNKFSVLRLYAVRSSSGFTLLELVVVVAILTILAGVAVRSMDGLDQQARFDATQRCMRDISDAALATGQNSDVSLLVSGFLADMGRLPIAIGTDPNLQLQELWSNPRNLQPFAILPAQTNPACCDPEVLVACGWRGNYLRLGVGQSALVDGWGQAFDLLSDPNSGIRATAGEIVAAVRSRGANGTLDSGATANYDADVMVSLAAGGSSSTVSGRVFKLDAGTGQLCDPDSNNGAVTVLYFGPDPNTGRPWAQSLTVPTPFTSVTYSFAGTPGPRVIRAYQGVATTAGNWATAPVKSIPVRLTLLPGGQAKDLILR